MAPAFCDYLTMVYVDLRGGGRSTGRATDLTFDRVAEDVDAIRAALGADRFMLLGHSILALLAHIMGTLAPGWTVTADPESLTAPVLLTHGRSESGGAHKALQTFH